MTDEIKRPRASSIVALGLTKKTRHFLMSKGIRTVDAFINVDEDILCAAQADRVVYNEIIYVRDNIVPSRIPSFPNLKDVVDEETDSGLSQALDDERDGGGNSRQSQNKEVAFDSDAHDLPDQLSFKHVSLDAVENSFITPDRSFSQEGLNEDKLVDYLMADELESVVFYSSDSQQLKKLAEAAMHRYEDIKEERSDVSYWFSMPLAQLSFPKRVSTIFRREGIQTVGELCDLGEVGLAGLHGAGVRVVDDVRFVLSELDERLLQEFDKQGEKQVFMAAVSDLSEDEVNAHWELLHSVPFDVEQLSVRARNVFENNKIETVGKALALGEDGLMQLKSAGAKTVDEILYYARKQAFECVNQMNICLSTERQVDERTEDCAGLPEADVSYLEIKNALLVLTDLAFVSPWLISNLLESGADVDEIRGFIVESLILCQLRDNPWGLSIEELLKLASVINAQPAATLVEESLNKLKERALVFEESGIWNLNYISLEDAIRRSVSNPSHQEMIMQRLRGKTLEEVGSQLGVTRERARQVTNGSVRRSALRGTRAEIYYKLMNEYDLSEEQLCKGLYATPEEWRLCSLLVKQYKVSGSRGEASAALDDKRIPPRVRFSLEKIIFEGQVKIDGDYLPKKRLDLMLYVLKRYGSKISITEKELKDRYEQLLEENGIQECSELELSDRYIGTLRSQKCVLVSYWSRLRYYDFDFRRVAELVSQLGFEKYQGKEISTLVLFRNNQELLLEYEIDDYYELHNLLRTYEKEAKKCGEDAPYMIGRRMPMLHVGETNRTNQVVELAEELSPISLDELAEAYEEEYGIEKATFLGGDFREAVSGFVDLKTGLISMDLKPLTETEANRMKEVLQEDFYPLTTFEALYRQEFPKAGTSRLNSLSVRKLGFVPHRSYILRESWKQPDDLFESIVFRSEFFDESAVPTEIRDNNRQYGIFFNRMVKERRLLPYDLDSWITEKGLKELEIDDSALLDFATKCADYCKASSIKYCTRASLVGSGFTHELLDYEFTDDFYTAVLGSNETAFTTLRCAHKLIACLDGAEPTTAAFIDENVPEGESRQLDDLIEFVQEEYGVPIKRDRLIVVLPRTDLFYSQITDKVYKTKDVFLREVE